ncbi:MAG: hypothetical protein JW803_02090 [Endomicrobiales bacterium]|nr:hypothetical protein [Endomicrobiales bacterium]
MKPDDLKDFLGTIRETDIEELVLESGDTKISFKKSEVPHVVVKEADNGQASAGAGKKFKPFKSPMVGTFYHSESPDHPPFVIEGNHIVPGQKLGIIEAMKIIKDVNSDIKGKIAKVLVKNAQSVEYGQELFLIDTEHEKK